MGTAGSPRDVHHLVDAYYAALYRYAYRLSGSPLHAEDLTQEAFCKAQANLGQLRDPARVRPWLFSILRTSYLHWLRSQKQHPCLSLDGVGDVAGPGPDEPPDIDPERLQQALNELPEEFRTPIILFYFSDFSYRDIAEQMDLPLGTVMSRLSRAKGFLRARLTPPAPVGAAAARPGRTAHGL